jgi:hypothetical protein
MGHHVASNIMTSHEWLPSVFPNGDIAEKITRIKQQEGQDLHVYGSANLVQKLAFWLKIFSITLGGGKRLFADGTIPAAFKVTESTVTSKGVILENYQRAGAVPTGSLSTFGGVARVFDVAGITRARMGHPQWEWCTQRSFKVGHAMTSKLRSLDKLLALEGCILILATFWQLGTWVVSRKFILRLTICETHSLNCVTIFPLSPDTPSRQSSWTDFRLPSLSFGRTEYN